MHITHTLALIAGLSLTCTALAKGSYSWANQGIFAHTNQDGPEGRSLNHVPPIDLWLTRLPSIQTKPMQPLARAPLTPHLFASPQMNVTSVLSLVGVGHITSNHLEIGQWDALDTFAFALSTSAHPTRQAPVQLSTSVPVPATIALLGLATVLGRHRRRQPN